MGWIFTFHHISRFSSFWTCLVEKLRVTQWSLNGLQTRLCYSGVEDVELPAPVTSCTRKTAWPWAPKLPRPPAPPAAQQRAPGKAYPGARRTHQWARSRVHPAPFGRVAVQQVRSWHTRCKNRWLSNTLELDVSGNSFETRSWSKRTGRSVRVQFRARSGSSPSPAKLGSLLEHSNRFQTEPDCWPPAPPPARRPWCQATWHTLPCSRWLGLTMGAEPLRHNTSNRSRSFLSHSSPEPKRLGHSGPQRSTISKRMFHKHPVNPVFQALWDVP